MPEQGNTPRIRQGILSVSGFIIWPLAFLAALYAAHRAVLYAYHCLTPRCAYDIDVPPHWPFSIYNPRGPHGLVVYTALALSIVVGVWALRRLPKRNFPPGEVATFGLGLVLLTNAIQGVPKGFYNPVAGGVSGEQYYHDGLRVTGSAAFLRAFNTIQPTLHTHARTHPPGAVLLYWIAHNVIGLPPEWISVAIAVFCVLISAWAFCSFARSLLNLDDRTAGYATLLYLVLPAVQIYYCATLDAVIATLLLAAAALWLRPVTVGSTLAGAFAVTLASFLTFGFAWILPVLLTLDLSRGIRCWWRVGAVFLLMTALYGSLRLGFRFDYLEALRTASHLENPMGFRGKSEPVSFTFTRFEDITEMTAFFGPYLLALLLKGMPILRREQRGVWWIVFIAAGTLLGLFLSGAYHTGETARACEFLYPYLLLPVLYLMKVASDRDRSLILACVLAQSIAMQTWGNWFW